METVVYAHRGVRTVNEHQLCPITSHVVQVNRSSTPAKVGTVESDSICTCAWGVQHYEEIMMDSIARNTH